MQIICRGRRGGKTVEAIIPKGDRCPPGGKDRCIHRGYYGIDLPYCHRYKEPLVQGKTKTSQRKCRSCLEKPAAIQGEWGGEE